MDKFLDTEGLSYLWGRIKSTFAMQSDVMGKQDVLTFMAILDTTDVMLDNITKPVNIIENCDSISGNDNTLNLNGELCIILKYEDTYTVVQGDKIYRIDNTKNNEGWSDYYPTSSEIETLMANYNAQLIETMTATMGIANLNRMIVKEI